MHAKRLLGRAVLLLVAGGLLAPAAGAGRLEPELERRLAEKSIPAGGLRVGVTLREEGLPALPARVPAEVAALREEVLRALPAGSFALGRAYGRLAGFAGRATAPALRALERSPRVETVYVDGRVHADLAQGAGLVGARDATAAGHSGAGAAVAVLDTGVDTDHPDLEGDLVAEQCFCDDHPSPSGCCPAGGDAESGPGSAEDDGGHGTSVAGIVSSAGAAAPAGVAPEAPLVAVKVLSASGSGRFSDIAAGLDWLLAEREALGLRVVNLSLGDGGAHSDASASPCSGTNAANAIAALHAAGVAVFASSGNEGHDDGIGFPACVAEAIAVGGVYDADVGPVSWCGNSSCTSILCTDSSTGADVFVCHTSSGELLDLLAPDYATTTSAAGGGTRVFGGTSAAAPYAAGEAALLFGADPSLAPEELRALLTSNGPMVTNPESGLAFPRADVALALAERLGLACGDGLDNDGDGFVDAAEDLGCRTVFGELEDPECEDGVNNDSDGLIDWDGGGEPYPDPQCEGTPWANREAALRTGGGRCGLGFELTLLLPALSALRRALRGPRRSLRPAPRG